MLAIKIKMMPGCDQSYRLSEIDEIYLNGCSQDGYYKKAVVHDYVKNNPGSIQVSISPYPNLVPAVSTTGEKYVRSQSNDSTQDNLLSLPRE